MFLITKLCLPHHHFNETKFRLSPYALLFFDPLYQSSAYVWAVLAIDRSLSLRSQTE